jgi:hypothetical protein
MLIAFIVFSSLLAGISSILQSTTPASHESKLNNYSLDFTNETEIFSVASFGHTSVTLDLFFDSYSNSFQSEKKESHEFSFSFPGKHYFLTASFVNSNWNDTFLVNKSIYQPLPLFYTYSSHLLPDNTTKITINSSIALDPQLNPLLNKINASDGNYFYELIINENISLTIIDSYYRSFSIFLLALVSSNGSPPILDIDPTPDPNPNPNIPPIIIINGTRAGIGLNNSNLTIIDKNIQNEFITANSTSITNVSSLNSHLSTNYSFIDNLQSYFSSFDNNQSILVKTSLFVNSSISSNYLSISESKLFNSTLVGNHIIVTNSLIGGTIIDSSNIIYQNVTFLNNTLSEPLPESPKIIPIFNYSVSYLIEQDTNIMFDL